MAARHAFGRRSKERLATVHPALALVCNEALGIVPFDLTVLCGRRGREDQEKAVREGRSKVHWPHGKHNVRNEGDLARAVDIAPYPIDWSDTARFVYLAGVMDAVARAHNVRLRWGGNWDGDGVLLKDQRFDDLPHFELRG